MDQSGNDRTAVQDRSARRPTLVTDALNGKPAVSFDGKQFMTFTLPVNGLTGMTVILVSASAADWDGGPTNAEHAAIFWNEKSPWGTVYLSPYQTNVKFRFGTGEEGSTDALFVNGVLESMQEGDNGTFFPGQIAEVLVYARALTDAERQAVEAYLAARYFPAEH
jgi:hypothetical protein